MRRNLPISGVNDTSAAAAEVQFRLLSAMPPSRKISLVEDANRTSRRLALGGIALRFPGATTEQSFRLLMDLILGEELAAKVYGAHSGAPAR